MTEAHQLLLDLADDSRCHGRAIPAVARGQKGRTSQLSHHPPSKESSERVAPLVGALHGPIHVPLTVSAGHVLQRLVLPKLAQLQHGFRDGLNLIMDTIMSEEHMGTD